MKAFFALLLSTSAAFSETSPEWLAQLQKATAAVREQSFTLISIQKDFPSLASSAKEANQAFQTSALGKGDNAANAELQSAAGEKSPGDNITSFVEMSEKIKALNLNEETAKAFIADVNHSKAKMDPIIRATLLAAHPEYVKIPAKEFADGWTQKYAIADIHSPTRKALAHISYPASWTIAQPNEITDQPSFVSKAGNGPLSSTIEVRLIPGASSEPLTEAEIGSILSPAFQAKMIPEDATLDYSKPIELNGSKAAFTCYDRTIKTKKGNVNLRFSVYTIVEKSNFIILTFFFPFEDGTLPYAQVIKNTQLLTMISQSYKAAK